MKSKKKEGSAFTWILKQGGEHKKEFVISFLLAFVGVTCSLIPFFKAIEIVKGIMENNRNFQFYIWNCGIMTVAWMARVIFHGLSTRLSHQATFATLAEIRKNCIEKLVRMPLGHVLNQSTGGLKNILVERIDSIETTLAHIVPEFTTNLIAPVLIIIYIFTIDWRMALASLATLPICLICLVLMMDSSKKYFAPTMEAVKTLNNTSVEYINGIQVIKVFGKTKSSYEKFERDAKEAANSYVRWMKANILPFTFALVITPANLIAVLPIGGLFVRNGSLSPENFVSIMILSLGMLGPIITCLSYNDDIAMMKEIVSEVRGILDGPEMIRPLTSVESRRNDIVLKDVHFAYDEKEILHGINLRIPEGSFIAFVGPSGSGKSTIARLIASLWDVNEGSISFGGTDIREISFESFADRIAFVSQDNYLFNMSILENIRLGRQDASDDQVIQAAKDSGCHEFILGLENGYDTIVGASGSHLSGGERQRISIARAMLKNAPIVILDEATAYMDPENEAVIEKSVSSLTQGKTLIVIAHRLSTITNADCIYLVEDGQIKDQGSHKELLSHHGLYEKMWKAHIAVKNGGEKDASDYS